MDQEESQATCYYDLTLRQCRGVRATCYLDCAMYLLLLFWASYNIKLYLIEQKRFRQISVLMFYLVTVVICVTRIFMYVGTIIAFDPDFDDNVYLTNPFIYDEGYVISLYFTVLLGLFQSVSMTELAIRIRQPLVLHEDKAHVKRKVRCIYWSAGILTGVTVTTCALLTAGMYINLDRYIMSCDDPLNPGTGC